MTYQDALKARARVAYGINKKAEWSPFESAVVGTGRDDAAIKHNKDKAEEQARTAADYSAKKDGIVNRAKGEQAARDIADQKAAEEQARVASQYIDQMNGIVNRAKGEEESRQRAAANDYLQNQVPQNIIDAQVLKKLELGAQLTPEEQQRGLELMSSIKDQMNQDRIAADDAAKAKDAEFNAQGDAMRALALRDQFLANGQGNAIAAQTNADRALLESQEKARTQKMDEIYDKPGRVANRNLGIGIGAGALGGLAAGGAAYGLAGLFPSLKKRRLLRALIALGVGGAAGTGIGIGTTKGLNSGALQNAYGASKNYLAGVGNALAGKA